MVALIVYASRGTLKIFSNAQRNADLLKGFYLMDFLKIKSFGNLPKVCLKFHLQGWLPSELEW